MAIYIIKLERPIGNPNHRNGTAQYYIGWCKDGTVKRRVAEHKAGRGAAMLRAAVLQGIDFDVVITMPGTRADERRLKRQKNARRIVERLLAQKAKAAEAKAGKVQR